MIARFKILIIILILLAAECSVVGALYSTYYIKAAPAQSNIEGFKKFALKSLEYNPQNGYARMEYARKILLTEAKFEDARKEALISTETYNSVNSYVQIGAIYLKLNDYKNAIDYFERANRMLPDDPLTLLKVAQILMDIQDYKRALEVFSQVIEVEPNNVKAYYQISVIYGKLKNYKQQINYLKKMLLIEKDVYDEAILSRIAHLYYYQLDDVKKATYYYESLMKVTDKNPDYYRRLYMCYKKTGDTQQAEKLANLFREKFHLGIED